jgi:hypothetical protein
MSDNYIKGMTAQDRANMDGAIAARVLHSFEHGPAQLKAGDTIDITMAFQWQRANEWNSIPNLIVEQRHVDAAIRFALGGDLEVEAAA